MRELKRSIARHLMEMNGIAQINKRNKENPMRRDRYGRTPKASYFSLHWREYLDPASPYRKSLENKLRADAARQTRMYGKGVMPGWPVPMRRAAH